MREEAGDDPGVSAALALLTSAFALPTEPIDDLTRRLAFEPAGRVLERAAAWWPAASDPGGWRPERLSMADADTLRRWAGASKGAFAAAEVRARRDSALLGFLVAVAAARVYRGVEITTVSPDTLERWLADAAGACGGDLAELLASAAERGPGEPTLHGES